MPRFWTRSRLSSSMIGELTTLRMCCASRQMYGASMIEIGATNWPKIAAPSSTIWMAPLEVDSTTSREPPSWPPGKSWISTAPAVSSFTCLAMRSIMIACGWFGASTVAQRNTTVCARARRGAKIPAAAAPAIKCRLVIFTFGMTFPPRCFLPRFFRTSENSVGRAAARDVEDEAGGKRTFRRRHPADQRRNLLHLDGSPARYPRNHIVDVFLCRLRKHRRARHRRRDRVDRDVVGGELLAQRFGEADQRRFRGGIGRGVGVAFLAGDGGDVDDAPVVLRDHRGDDGVAAVERSLEIDLHGLLQLGERIFPKFGGGAGYAGVVDQNVDTAEVLQCEREGAVDAPRIGDIDLIGPHAAADFTGGF